MEFGLEGVSRANGTRVFFSNGDLWGNRVEDPSGWLFTHGPGDSYVAIRAGKVKATGVSETKPIYGPTESSRRLKRRMAIFLSWNDMWAPV